MSKERVDWDAIEPHYRAGVRSLKDIGSEYGVSDAAIIKHARKFDWSRNLAGKIQAKADAKVSAATVSAEVRESKKLTEAARVEVESEVQARIRLSHRTDIQRSKRIANKLLEVLEGLKTTGKTLKEHSGVLHQLASTQRVLVTMEREAFGIVQMTEAPSDPANIDPIEGARRLAFVLHRASLLMPKR